MTELIMDSTEQVQVGASLKHPRIGPLSLRERARVRADRGMFTRYTDLKVLP
jgi:hypothetical protein